MDRPKLEREVGKLHEELQASLRKAQEPLDRQGRALQRAFFACGTACSAATNDTLPASEVVRPTPPTTNPNPHFSVFFF